MISGRPLLWKKDEVRTARYDALNVGRLRLPRYGDEWTIGNVLLVNEIVATGLSVTSAQNLLFCAKHAAEFIKFKEKCDKSWSAERILGEYDEVRCALIAEPKWAGLTATKRAEIIHLFKHKANRAKHEPKQLREYRRMYSAHCADLFDAQRGRCALTGIRITDDFSLGGRVGLDIISADRLDDSVGHVIGNVRLVILEMNLIRRENPVEVFDAVMRNIAEYSPTPGRVLERLEMATSQKC